MRVVLITGAASGLGWHLARACHARGDHLLLTDIDASGLAARTAELDPNRVLAIAGDICEPAVHHDLLTACRRRFGRLDVLINNAGGSPAADAASASPRFHESIIRLNLIAPLNVAQHANRLMQAQEQGGCIVFIGSISAQRPSPGTAAYGAAKAGVVALVTSLAVEWAPKVRVVTVSPGLVLTDQAHLHYGSDAGIAAVSAGIPAARMAVAEDIANACLYIASPLASYASGCNLLLHGGGERPAFLGAAQATPT